MLLSEIGAERMRESDNDDADQTNGSDYAVGYRRPPLHTRFPPGVSGNPSGRRKCSKNIRTIFEKILGEEIALREGGVTKKITKAEAIVRALVLGAIKGESSSQQNLFRLAQQTVNSKRHQGTCSASRG